MKIKELIEKCHQASLDGGWYTNLDTGEKLDRNIGEMMVLIHSEVSEAYDAWINNDMDEKLPHRLGVEVELADTLIRIFDLAGYLNLKLDDWTHKEIVSNQSLSSWHFSDVHSSISNAYENYRKSNMEMIDLSLGTTLQKIIVMCELANLDIEGAIEEKLEFNANRADHKIENRKKPGGKRT